MQRGCHLTFLITQEAAAAEDTITTCKAFKEMAASSKKRGFENMIIYLSL